MTNVNADGSDKTPREIELEAKLAKAEGKIVKMKDSLKEDAETKDESKKDNNNKEETLDKDTVAKMIADAVKADREAAAIEANLEATDASSLGGEAKTDNGFNLVTANAFDKMTPESRKKYMSTSDEIHGEVKFKPSSED